MTDYIPKTRAQQRVAWLENLGRPLTNDESDMLRRSLHATYVYDRKTGGGEGRILARVRAEELVTLSKVEAELYGPDFQAKDDLATLSPFERQERALANGAKLIANDTAPSPYAAEAKWSVG